MTAIYQCQGCGAQFEDGEVAPFYLNDPHRPGDFITCPKCGNLRGVKDLRSPQPRRGISSATAMVLGMVAAVSEPFDDTPRMKRIRGQEQCTSCGAVDSHTPDCRPPRGFRKV